MIRRRSASVSLRAARLTAPMGLSAAAAAAGISKSQLDRDLMSGTARGRCAQVVLAAAGDARRSRRAAAAAMVWCPPAARLMLATDEASRVRYRVPGCAAAVAATAAEGTVGAQLAAAASSRASRAVLVRLTRDVDPRVAAAAVRNPNCPALMMINVACDGDAAGMQSQDAADNPAASTALMACLSASGDSEVVEHTAANPNCPKWLLETMSSDVYSRGCPHRRHAQEFVASNPSAPLEMLQRLAESSSDDVAAEVIRNPECPPNLLRSVLDDNGQSERVRSAAAASERCPASMLARLVHDEQLRVVVAAARNPGLGPGHLARLADDHSPRVRAAAAANVALGPGRLKRLSGDTHAEVRAAVAKNPATDPELLDRLAEDDHTTVRAAVAANPAAASKLIDRLAKDDYTEVRVAVAAHPAAGLRSLEELRYDSELQVSWAAARAALDR